MINAALQLAFLATLWIAADYVVAILTTPLPV